MKYLILGNGSDWFRSMFADTKADDNILVGQDCFLPCWETKLSYYLCHALLPTGKKWSDSAIPCKMLYRELCRQIRRWGGGEKTTLILEQSNRLAHNRQFLRAVRKYVPNCTLIYWLIDTVAFVTRRVPYLVELCEEEYDFTVTYNPIDAEAYGFTYIETPYCRIIPKTEETPSVDVLYIGAAKVQADPKRYEGIMRVFESLYGKGFSCDFSIIGVPQELRSHEEVINFENWVSYPDSIGKVNRSRVILEVTQAGETGTTLRFFEAIAYNRKLITTNKCMEEHPLFARAHMHILDFEKPDWEESLQAFVATAEPASYDTYEQLSPYLFLERIEKLMEAGSIDHGKHE